MESGAGDKISGRQGTLAFTGFYVWTCTQRELISDQPTKTLLWTVSVGIIIIPYKDPANQ